MAFDQMVIDNDKIITNIKIIININTDGSMMKMVMTSLHPPLDDDNSGDGF